MHQIILLCKTIILIFPFNLDWKGRNIQPVTKSFKILYENTVVAFAILNPNYKIETWDICPDGCSDIAETPEPGRQDIPNIKHQGINI